MILDSIVAASRDAKRRLATTTTVLCIALSATSCGGGSGGTAVSGPPENIDLDSRTAAANTTAQSSSNACAPIQPFYWEVGDETGRAATWRSTRA